MHVTLVGAGNIGSHAAPLLASIPLITRLTLIDRDSYEERNLENQAIRPGDVGKSKALVQARNVRAQRPGLAVEAICKRVEQVPLGRLRCNVLLGAVDTRVTRQYLNEACWMLGLPWIDSGIHADAGLVRLSAFQPGPGQSCLECDWDDRHYATLEMLYSCMSPNAVPRTGASAVLGAVAGGLLAMECGRWLAGESQAGRELVFDTRGYKHRVIELRPNSRCRFSHGTPSLRPERSVPNTTAMSDIFALASADAALTVAGAGPFARRGVCANCGRHQIWVLANRMGCGRCGFPMPVTGFDLVPKLRKTDLMGAMLSRPLTRFGISNDDILVLEGGGDRIVVEVGAQHA